MKAYALCIIFVVALVSVRMAAQDSPAEFNDYLKKVRLFQSGEAINKMLSFAKDEVNLIACQTSWDEKYVACKIYHPKDRSKFVIKILDAKSFIVIADLRSDKPRDCKFPLFIADHHWAPDSKQLYVQMRYMDEQYGEYLPYDVEQKSFTDGAKERLRSLRDDEKLQGGLKEHPDPRSYVPAWTFRNGKVERVTLSGIDGPQDIWTNPVPTKVGSMKVSTGDKGDRYEIFGTNKYDKDGRTTHVGHVFHNDTYQTTIELAAPLFPSSTMLRYENSDLILYSFYGDGGKTNLGKQKYKGSYPGPDRGYFLETEDDKNINLYCVREIPKASTEDKK